MGNGLKAIMDQLNQFWAKFNAGQKRNIIIISALSLIIIIIAVSLACRQDYVVLYSGLNEKEKAEIYSKLKELKIKARIPSGTSSIEVPADKEAEIRMQLAMEGYPKSGFNYDIYLAGSSFGQTDAELQARWIFLLQERLSESIRILEGVEDAVVNIAIPETDTFVLKSQQTPVTASVIIKPNIGSQISYLKAQSIVQMITKSIPGLEEENVTIIDTNMNILNAKPSTEKEILSDHFELEYMLEQRTNAQITDMLERVFGYKKVAVSSNIGLNFDKRVIESVAFEPVLDDSGIAVSIEELKEKVKSGMPGGAAGEASNTTQYPESIYVENSDYEKTQRSINYGVNEIKEKIEEQQGKIDNLSISVLIDNENMDAQMLNSVKELVANAIGTDPVHVAVQSMKFDTSFQQKLLDSFNDRVDQKQSWFTSWALIFALGAIVFAVAIFMIMRTRKNSLEETLSQASAMEEQSIDESIHEEIDVELKKEDQIKRQLDKFITQKPDAVAQLLRNWLSED